MSSKHDSSNSSSSTLDFDDRAARHVEAVYSTPDIAATRVAVFRAANPRRGETALDLGCGPGYLLRDLAAAVGPAGTAIGLDISAPMLALAQRRCEGLPQIRVEKADATALPLDDASVDLACVTQVYAYVPALDTALVELRRALKPGGRAIILDTDFAGVVWESRDRARMRRVMEAYDAHVAWPDLPRILPARLRHAGLTLGRVEAVPIVTTHYHAHSYVHGIARFIHSFAVKRGIARDEADAWLAEFDALEAGGAFLFAMNRFMFTVTRA